MVGKSLSTQAQVKFVSIDLIDPPEYEIREYVTREALEELASSIKQVGIIEPLLISPHNNRYRIVAGYRRLLACKMLKMTAVPCIIKSFTREKTLLVTAHENIMREDVDPLSLAKYLKYLAEEFKVSADELGKKFGHTESWVFGYLKLLEVPENIQAAVQARHIDLTSGLQLARIPNPVRRDTLLKAAVESGATQSVVRNWVKDELMREASGNETTQFPTSEIVSTEPIEVTFKCEWCKNSFPTSNMFLTRLCNKCHIALRKAFKIEEEKSHESD